MPVYDFPAFTKIGTILSKPAGWGGDGVLFPRVLDMTAARAAVPTLPGTEAWALFISTDHASPETNSRVAYCLFDDIEVDDLDAALTEISGLNGDGETAQPVIDDVNGRLNIYVHESVSFGTYGQQQTLLHTTTDLSTCTEVGGASTAGRHNGYATVYKDPPRKPAGYHMWSNTGNVELKQLLFSGDGETFVLQHYHHAANGHLTPASYVFSGHPQPFYYDGRWWLVGCLENRTGGGRVRTSYGVAPLSSDWRYLLDSPRVLVSPTGAGDETTYENNCCMFYDGTDLYLLYVAINGTSVSNLQLAKATGSTQARVRPTLGVREKDGNVNGGVSYDGVVDYQWDAVNEAKPEWMDTYGTATEGVVDDYYRFGKNDAGSYYLFGPSIDVGEHHIVDYTITGLHRNTQTVGTGVGNLRVGLTTATGTAADFNNVLQLRFSEGGNEQGSYFVVQSTTTLYDNIGDILEIGGGSQQVRDMAADLRFELTLRSYDYGRVLMVLINGQIHEAFDMVALGGSAWDTLSLWFRVQPISASNEWRFTGIKVRSATAESAFRNSSYSSIYG